jgi:hypothetical protein
VTFSVNTAALSKAVGTYGPTTVTFTNTTNNQGTTTRTAGLTVSPNACEAIARGPEFDGGAGAKGDILWRSDAAHRDVVHERHRAVERPGPRHGADRLAHRRHRRLQR